VERVQRGGKLEGSTDEKRLTPGAEDGPLQTSAPGRAGWLLSPSGSVRLGWCTGKTYPEFYILTPYLNLIFRQPDAIEFKRYRIHRVRHSVEGVSGNENHIATIYVYRFISKSHHSKP